MKTPATDTVTHPRLSDITELAVATRRMRMWTLEANRKRVAAMALTVAAAVAQLGCGGTADGDTASDVAPARLYVPAAPESPAAPSYMAPAPETLEPVDPPGRISEMDPVESPPVDAGAPPVELEEPASMGDAGRIDAPEPAPVERIGLDQRCTVADQGGPASPCETGLMCKEAYIHGRFYCRPMPGPQVRF